MKNDVAIVWFRQDLRLKDNKALSFAVTEGYQILPVFILDDENAGKYKHGAASRWWLYKALQSLNESLEANLVFRKGDAQTCINELIENSGAKAIFWNRCYEPWRIDRDKKIKSSLKEKQIEVKTFNASLLWEPWEIETQSGTPYKVFTPFYRKACLPKGVKEKPLPAPSAISYADFRPRYDESYLDLLPEIQWYRSFENHWVPGESGAWERLDYFMENGLKGYKEKRNNPNMDHTSRLSPYLRFGEISPLQIWHAVNERGVSEGWETDVDNFCSEIGWREFSYHLLYHFPDLPDKPLMKKFSDFPWPEVEEKDLKRWQTGNTGIPIVDAGMRQLWQMGWMHNRVRMIVGSLLTKNMLIHWKHGENWFWDCLVDADLANNSAGWQWVAGCGADAAPYFRVFNPVLQGEKFDPDGEYVMEFVPELRGVAKKYVHKPWESDQKPDGYPDPIVDLRETRKKALAAYEKIK